jgi:hypothetical protein
MSLKDDFVFDFVKTFANLDEFAESKTFEITENHKPKKFTTDCVWDDSKLKDRTIVQLQGVYMGDVLWFVLKSCFSVEPKVENIIWEIIQVDKREVRRSWRVMQIIDAEKVYEIALDRITS